MVIPTNI